LAKFKKKTSEPTIDPSDSKKDPVEVSTPTPEIEISEPISNDPSGEPPASVAEKSEKDRKLNKLFWMRIALAIIAGTAATFIFEGVEGEDRRWASIGFMIVIFFGTVIVAKGMKMQLPSSDRKKVVTQAIGSYVFLYLFSWIVSYTLTHLGSTSSGINI
jgi:hypothetical protein